MTAPVQVRVARPEDAAAIVALYRAVAAVPGGIARTPQEITPAYVAHFLEHSLQRGIALVAEADDVPGIAGELHAWRGELRAFAHVLGELTVAVHPRAQGRGIGRSLFTRLLELVQREHSDVTRIELVAQESNQRAIALYEAMGFQREGRMQGRILAPHCGVEADIPLAWLRQPGPPTGDPGA